MKIKNIHLKLKIIRLKYLVFVNMKICCFWTLQICHAFILVSGPTFVMIYPRDTQWLNWFIRKIVLTKSFFAGPFLKSKDFAETFFFAKSFDFRKGPSKIFCFWNKNKNMLQELKTTIFFTGLKPKWDIFARTKTIF